MTFNLNAAVDISTALNPRRWTALQTEICMNVALAKRDAFIVEAQRMAEFVRLGFITRAMAADYLQVSAIYNQLCFEYGADHIQKIIAGAFEAIA